MLQPNVPSANLYSCPCVSFIWYEGKSASSFFQGYELRSLIVTGLRNALFLSKRFQTSPPGKAFSACEWETQERVTLSLVDPIRQQQPVLGERSSRGSPVPQGDVLGCFHEKGTLQRDVAPNIIAQNPYLFFRRLFIALSWICVLLNPCRSQEVPDDKPNVVLIMVDDLGIGDLGCFGNDTMR